jgi:ABC-type uncharacterized transport system involved in gliding motility auxiliary subunit
MMAVMELKRALVTVQEMSLGNSPDVKAKSGEVVAGIEALLAELGEGTTAGMPAGIVSLEEAPVLAPAVTEEPVAAEEPAHAEEPAPAEEEPAEEPAEEEPTEEAPAEEESSASEEGDDEEEEEDDE